MHTAFIIVAAVVLDRMIGEPERFHPLVLFGRVADRVESLVRQPHSTVINGRCRGVLALLIIMLVTALFFSVLMAMAAMVVAGQTVLSVLIVYSCIAWRSLKEHALAIAEPLKEHRIDDAREHLKLIVSRDVDTASRQDIATATCESVLENGSDGIFSALFWFMLAGVPGIIVYRAANTLDAMWGYKNERFEHFGWAAAKLDDALNWIPARLTAFSYALMGCFGNAMRCWNEQGRHWKSPNAGPVMAAGAGSLNIRLGGDAYYRGELEHRPLLGSGEPANVDDIERALDLVDRTLILWLLCVVIYVL